MGEIFLFSIKLSLSEYWEQYSSSAYSPQFSNRFHCSCAHPLSTPVHRNQYVYSQSDLHICTRRPSTFLRAQQKVVGTQNCKAQCLTHGRCPESPIPHYQPRQDSQPTSVQDLCSEPSTQPPDTQQSNQWNGKNKIK